MSPKPFAVISLNTKDTITEGKKYEVQRVTLRSNGTYYHIVDDIGKKVKLHAGNFRKLDDVERRDF